MPYTLLSLSVDKRREKIRTIINQNMLKLQQKILNKQYSGLTINLIVFIIAHNFIKVKLICESIFD